MHIYLSNNIRNIHYYDNKLIVILKSDNRQIIFCSDVEIYILQKSLSGISLTSLAEALIDEFKLIESQKKVLDTLYNYYNKYWFLFTFVEEERWKKIILTGKKNKFLPYRIQIELTSNCNLYCPHCYKNANVYKINIDYKSLEDFINFSNNSLYEIGLTGGEPLLHPQFCEIALLCARHCCQLELNTNGLLLYKLPIDIIRLFKYISISLYGLSDIEYENNVHNKKGYSLLYKSCYFLKENNVCFNISVILKKSTIERIEEYVIYAINLGAYSIQFGTANEIGRGKDIKDGNDWYLSKDNINVIYKQIRMLSKKYNHLINIIQWEREGYQDFDNPAFSVLNPSSCFQCSAGTLQWGINEKMIFKPCAILPDKVRKNLNLVQWKQYVNGINTLNWNEYIDDLNQYCISEKTSICSFCDRLILSNH